MTAFVCYGQFLTTMSTTGSQNATTVGGSHSLKETVFVATLALRRLECTFHFRVGFYAGLTTGFGGY